MKKRVYEIDFLKCVCITLMVIFHLVFFADKYPYAKQIVYTFHMAAFLIVSGYLSNANKDPLAFFRTLLWLFIPYAIMESGYVLMSSILPVREPVADLTLLFLFEKILLSPIGPYWYLHTLILCSAVYYIVYLFTNRLNEISRLICLGLAYYALSLFCPSVSFYNAMYFGMGVLVSHSRLRFTDVFRPSLLALIPFILFCFIPELLNRALLSGVVITYLVISFLLYLYRILPDSVRRVSAFVGRNTLAVLLFSPLFTMLSKLYVPLFSFDPTGILFMLTSVFLALSGSFLIAFLMDKMRVSRFFCGRECFLS